MKMFLALVLLLPYWQLRADDGPKRLVLVSYCIGRQDTQYRFDLLSLREFIATTSTHSHDKGDFPNSGYLGNVAALKQVLEQVPPGSVIEWRGWKPAETCYPPQPIIDDIRAFVAARDVQLRLPSDNPNE